MRLSADQLKEMLVGQGMLIRQVAEALGVSTSCINYWIDRYRIRPSEGPPRWMSDKPLPHRKFLLSPDELRKLYHHDGKTIEEIAAMLGVERSCVTTWVRKYGLRLGKSELAERCRHHNYKGPRRTWASSGYVYIRDPSNPSAYRGYIEEHKAVVEHFIKGYLTNGERIHHINMDKTDNRIENLAVLNRSQHALVHRYYERVGVFLLGLAAQKPTPLEFKDAVLWGGRYLTHLDLLEGRDV